MTPSVSERGPVVLVVDDDEGIRESLRMALSYEGYDVRLAADGADGLEQLDGGGVDAAIVDVMMPHVDGITMCRALRRRGDATPVLVLTARTAVADRVEGLDAGADDYLIKPFDLDELLARVRVMLRRTNPTSKEVEVDVGDLRLDLISRDARRGDRCFTLTTTEFSLLRALMDNAGTVQTREQLYEEIWGHDLSASSRALDVYISYLRTKTEAGGEPRIIETVRGVGFRIRLSA